MAEIQPLGEVTIDRQNDVWIVTLVGEHCLSTAEELRAALESLLDPDVVPLSRPTLVLVDLSQVTFFDSTVVGVIARAYDLTADDPDAALVIVVESADSYAARVVQMLGLPTLVPAYTSRASAVSALKAGAPDHPPDGTW
jgi:anti-anti-sigma factor